VRTLIVGGGPAGLTLAIALRRRGLEADLVEVQPRWEVLGTGLSLGGAPLRALRTVGLAERCVAAGFGSTTLAIGNAAGEIVQVVERPRLNGPEYPAALGIMRPALHRVLADGAADSGATVRLGLTVKSLTQHANGVGVSLSDGSTSEYDLVVGADGLHSAIRAMLFDDREPPRFTGQAVWRATLHRPDEVTGPAMYYGPRNKAGLTPVSHEEIYLFLVENVETVQRPPRGRLAALLREQLVEYRGLIGELREQIVDDRRVDYRPLHTLMLSPPWHRGRVLLIGDAAHSTTPHLAAGAGLAIEDAVVLAELLDGATAVPDAFASFMHRRYDRCRTIVESSLQLGEWEKRPGSPDADPVGLSTRAWSVLAQPI
jgi:2-polyprenyl-6-methoxyphenol hydroxylase-like FAD-dependent oxidoreductase